VSGQSPVVGGEKTSKDFVGPLLDKKKNEAGTAFDTPRGVDPQANEGGGEMVSV